jgi:hypothetical protein
MLGDNSTRAKRLFLSSFREVCLLSRFDKGNFGDRLVTEEGHYDKNGVEFIDRKTAATLFKRPHGQGLDHLGNSPRAFPTTKEAQHV